MLVFAGIFALIALLDYIELMRRAADIPNVSALLVAKTSFYRVPQVTERILPFCVLIGAMSCYLNLSRRLELVIARAAGMSAWQFIAPALLGGASSSASLATALYNPVCRHPARAVQTPRGRTFRPEQRGVRQQRRTVLGEPAHDDGQAIINAKSSRDQGAELSGVTVFTFDHDGPLQAAHRGARRRAATRRLAICWTRASIELGDAAGRPSESIASRPA